MVAQSSRKPDQLVKETIRIAISALAYGIGFMSPPGCCPALWREESPHNLLSIKLILRIFLNRSHRERCPLGADTAAGSESTSRAANFL
jgi:hypothetical protein